MVERIQVYKEKELEKEKNVIERLHKFCVMKIGNNWVYQKTIKYDYILYKCISLKIYIFYKILHLRSKQMTTDKLEIPGYALVMQGCILKEEEIPEFEKYFTEKLGSEIKYITTKITNPDDGNDIPDTGGRHDVIMIPKETSKVIITRMQCGLRWYEDVLGNGITYKE